MCVVLETEKLSLYRVYVVMEAKQVILRYLFSAWGRQIISYVLEMLIVKGFAML